MKPTLSKGNTVFIRCLGFAYLGRVVDEDPYAVWLEDASWVADQRKYHHDFLKGGPGDESEIEPYPDECCPVEVPRGPIQDACLWVHALPRVRQ